MKKRVMQTLRPDLGVEMSAAQSSRLSKKFGVMPPCPLKTRSCLRAIGVKLLRPLVRNAKPLGTNAKFTLTAAISLKPAALYPMWSSFTA